MMEKISEIIINLYGEKLSTALITRLSELLYHYKELLSTVQPSSRDRRLAEQDVILITYGDQIQEQGFHPLHTLGNFCKQYLTGLVSGIHILPFYPYSSDDGFSVINYKEVNPLLGSWEEVRALGKQFRLVFDAVINHVSVYHDWFRGFTSGDPAYQDYFITVDDDPNLSQVVRPRALPLLTTFDTSRGQVRVWTTFSADQVDLNYKNPQVLLEILDTLLYYVSQGAELIRLDAIAYLWKEIGTPCIHLPQTHHIIQLIRAVLDEVAPWVMLITETNVPHTDNVSYFGDGHNEAQMVYNFALPPLVLDALNTGDAGVLSKWAKGLTLPSKQVTFFNFLASHDGIGLNPVRGILPDNRIDKLVQKALDHGGIVSNKHNPDGSQSPYELNINYFDMLCKPGGATSLAEQVDRFMAAQAIMLAMIGVPGIYFHSLFGSRGWPEGVKQTGRSRTINRQKLQRSELEAELSNPDSRPGKVYNRYSRLLRARASSHAFHPFGVQRVIQHSSAIFAIERISPDHTARVVCIQNVSGQGQTILLDQDLFGIHGQANRRLRDLVSEKYILEGRQNYIAMAPYQSLWLTNELDN
ncbi:MAG: sugar phosphorylase [Chloroflexi bacterium RBG_16_57_11]|nr:MAG: sugar phosphorylase [Chloroflexi bacterium RBG_16_57_11]